MGIFLPSATINIFHISAHSHTDHLSFGTRVAATLQFNCQAAHTLCVLLCCFEKNIFLVFFVLFSSFIVFLNKVLISPLKQTRKLEMGYQPVTLGVGYLCVCPFSLCDPFSLRKKKRLIGEDA